MKIHDFQVGRFRFRRFLRANHAEENLRFLEAVAEFVECKEGPVARRNIAKAIQKQYLDADSQHEVCI